MHESVRKIWHDFSVKFEGFVNSPYVDVLGLVTVGAGNLIDPIHLALELPWKLSDGSLATKNDVVEQWQRVKDDRDRLKKLHWKYAAQLTTIRLTDEDIDAIVAKKLASNEVELRKWFPGFDEMPADGQLGILSLAWAAGPAFAKKFPNFTHYVNNGKWWEAAAAGKLRATGPDGTPNPGVTPRNAAQKLCFENAGDVMAHRTDPTVLHWPNKHPGQFGVAPAAPMRLDLPDQLGALATKAATDSRFALLDDARREATREMLGADPDEITKNDPPRNS